jgi:hypothetical protein
LAPDPASIWAGLQKFGPEAGSMISSLPGGMKHLYMQAMGAEPTAPGDQRATADFVRSGLLGGFGSMVGAPPLATDQEKVNALKHGAKYAAGYLDPVTTTQRWRNHPAYTAADLSTLLTGPEDAAGLMGLRAAAPFRVAGAAGRLMNPISAPLEVAGLASRAATIPFRGLSGVYKAPGVFSNAAVAAAKGANIDVRDLANPDFAKVYAASLQRSGISSKSARDALLRFHSPDPNAPVPRQVATGRTGHVYAQDTTAGLIDQAKANNGASAAALRGPAGPNPEAAAAQAQAAAAASTPGKINAGAGPDSEITFPDLVDHHVGEALAAAPTPSTPGDFAMYPASYPTAPKALDWLQGHVKSLADADDLTFPRLQRAHAELGALAGNASGVDADAINAMKQGLQKATDMRIGAGRVTGADPEEIAGSFGAADQAGPQATAGQARQSILNTGADGLLTTPTQDVRDFVNSPEGEAAFPDPQDRSNARLLTNHQDAITAPPQGGPTGVIAKNVRQYGAPIVGAIAGFVPGADAAKSTTRSLIRAADALTGGFVGKNIDAAVEKGAAGLANVGAGRGAPVPGGWLNVPAWTADATKGPLTPARYALPVLDRAGPGPPPPAPTTPEEAGTPNPNLRETAPPPYEDDTVPAAPADAPAGNAADDKAALAAGTPNPNLRESKRPAYEDDTAPAPASNATAQADGGRIGFAEGGQVADMTAALLKRAEAHQHAARAATKPMLGLSDDTVARALKLAQAGL